MLSFLYLVLCLIDNVDFCQHPFRTTSPPPWTLYLMRDWNSINDPTSGGWPEFDFLSSSTSGIVETSTSRFTEIADGDSVNSSANVPSLNGVRDSLIRLEDTIVFSLIERAKYPINSAIYNESARLVVGRRGSFIKFFAKRTEALHAQAGRYDSEEENAFFADCLPGSLVPSRSSTDVLHPVAKGVNINNDIWDIYINQLVPLFAAKGDDGNYALTAASDLASLQAISRRIHFGKFVAEAKFLDDPQEYTPLIIAKDRDALMKLLTVREVEEMVKMRVEKKAEIFGQEVTLHGENNGDGNYKIDPSAVARLYEEWIMPLTKEVQVEYLLRRLD